MANIFLGCPVYDGVLSAGTAVSLWPFCTRNHHVHVLTTSFSLVPWNCNTLWCAALNLCQQHDMKWFAMLHADIEPEHYWLDKLVEEAERYDADLMTAVVPIKNDEGMTSTAIAAAQGDRYRFFRRLTQSQVRHPQFPDTFDIQLAADALEKLPPELRIDSVPRTGLLTNTACMICRLDKPWATKVWFECFDGIAFDGQQWHPVGLSEDWVFSQRVAQQGGKVMATRRIVLDHVGKWRFRSHNTWGQPRDLG